MKKRIILILTSLILLCSPISVNAASTTPSGIPLSDLPGIIDNYTTNHVGTTIAGASIIALQDGEIIFNRSYGYADIANSVPVDETTIFEWASIGKLLVWVSVMQLVEQGRLDLNADLRTYLPDDFFKRLQYDSPITMYHLMHHNAGWGMRGTDQAYRSAKNLIDLEEAIRSFEPNQLYAPGTAVAYSNYGAALAGYIVEYITKQPFHSYVNENIFSVLGMHNTTTHPSQADNPVVSSKREQTRGYIVVKNSLNPALSDRDFSPLYPAGSAMGTVGDMAKFLSALIPYQSKECPLFINADTLQEMLTISYSYGNDIPGIAHGFFEEYYAVKTLGHVGSLLFAASRLTFSPESGFGLIILTNTDNQNFGAELEKILFGEYQPEKSGSLPDIRKLSNLTGWYSDAMRFENRGFLQLVASIPMPRNRLRALDENRIAFSGMEFVQISPYVFKENSSDFHLHLIVENNEVTRVLLVSYVGGMITAGAVAEYTSLTAFQVISVYMSLLLLLASLIYLMEIGMSKAIKKARQNKKKGIYEKPPLAKKLTNSLGISSAVMLLNYLIIVIRAMILAMPYRVLLPHFIINIAFMVFAPVCTVFVIMNLKQMDSDRKERLSCILSCVAANFVVLIMFFWEFYR